MGLILSLLLASPHHLTVSVHPHKVAETVVVEVDCQNGYYARTFRTISHKVEVFEVRGPFEGRCEVAAGTFDHTGKLMERDQRPIFTSPYSED
jgi:hypothetical protein